MKLVRVISKSRSGNQMEVIGKDEDGLRTLHIRRERNDWKYFVGCDREDKRFFLPLKV